MMTQHEEFEVGTHLDQSLRSGLTAVAQVVERLARSNAERDRELAQAVRERMLHDRLVGPQQSPSRQNGSGGSSTPSPAGGSTPATVAGLRVQAVGGQRFAVMGDVILHDRALTYLENSGGGVTPVDATVAWATAMSDVAADPADGGAVEAAAQLRDFTRARHGVDLAGEGLQAMPAPGSPQWSQVTPKNPVPMVWRDSAADPEYLEIVEADGSSRAVRGNVDDGLELAERESYDAQETHDLAVTGRWDTPVYVTGPAQDLGLDGWHYPIAGGGFVPEGELISPRFPDLEYRPVWARPDGEVDHALFAAVALGQARSVVPAPAVVESEIPVRVVGPKVEQALDVVNDAAANRSAAQGEAAAAAAAARETAVVAVVPAYRANRDRGVAPTKAGTPAEAVHRRQTWTLARQAWMSDNSGVAASSSSAARAPAAAAWDALPMKDKTDLYWKQYDTPAARTVTASATPPTSAPAAATSSTSTQTSTATTTSPAMSASAAAAPAAERGISPSKAATAEERDHRRQSWAKAEARFIGGFPAGTPVPQRRKAWSDLKWTDKADRYWAVYDDPARAQGPDGAASRGGRQEQLVSSSTPDGRQTVPAAAAGTVVGAASVEVSGERSTAAVPVPVGRTDADTPRGVTRERVIELNEQAGDYFASQATPGSKGRVYLEDRLTPTVVERGPFRVGYAPAGWTNLTDHLRRGGASDHEIVAAGLGTMSSRENVIDAFRDRATVAIRDGEGVTVGFVGRDLSGNDTAPKYVNTGGTPAYTKGDHLLGIAESAESARLVRVEGPFDAIAVTAAGGGRYAGVAPLGTALTATQADTIADRAASAGGVVWEAMDGDVAGVEATEKDFWLLRDRDVDVRLIPLPAGSDPAQLWRERPEQLRTMLEVAEAAPTAGVAVIDNVVREQELALRAGDSDAFEEVAYVADKVTAALPNEQDRAFVNTYTSAAIAQVVVDHGESEAQTAATTSTTTRGPAADEAADVGRDVDRNVNAAVAASDAKVSATSPAPTSATTPAATSSTAPTDVIGVTSTTSPQASSGTSAEGSAPRPTGDVEGGAARQVAAPGFPQPIREMLADAQHRRGTPARPTTQSWPDVGRGRTQRR